MAVIDWDVVDGAYAKESADGYEINRPVGVKELVGDASDIGKNPAVLLEALAAPGMPTRGSIHPTLPTAILEDRGARSIGSVSACVVDLVYRQRVVNDSGHGSAATWSITDAGQVSIVTSFATADGSQSASIWYKPNALIADIDPSPPPNARVRVGGVLRYDVARVLKATGILKLGDWNTYKAAVRAAAGKINADVWHGEPRGTWLFVAPTTRYYGLGGRGFTGIPSDSTPVYTELTFLQKPQGFYPILAYTDDRGLHPADCDTEAVLRTPGPPAVGTVRHRNGISMVSSQLETAFTPLFAFSPA